MVPEEEEEEEEEEEHDDGDGRRKLRQARPNRGRAGHWSVSLSAGPPDLSKHSRLDQIGGTSYYYPPLSAPADK